SLVLVHDETDGDGNVPHLLVDVDVAVELQAIFGFLSGPLFLAAAARHAAAAARHAAAATAAGHAAAAAVLCRFFRGLGKDARLGRFQTPLHRPVRAVA